MQKGSIYLCFCIVLMQFLHQLQCLPPVDPEVRAQLEAKVMSTMSLKDFETMVENDERVLNAPKSKIIIVPKPKNGNGPYDEGDLDQKAYIIQRKPKKYPKKATSEVSDYGMEKREFGDLSRRISYEPGYRFESLLKLDEKFPSLFSIGDLESAGTNPVKSFYESIVEKAVKPDKLQIARDPFALLEIAASDSTPYYQPHFNYEAYERDPTETKLKGKKYWRDSPDRREELLDENGCRTVIKKIMDPEDGKKSSSNDPKSVIITKECEYPNVNGPEAKIPEIQSHLRMSKTRLDTAPTVFDSETSSYENSRPAELQFGDSKAKDPLAPDYIDRMLETHFRSFPSFSNPITSFKGYQDRFKLRAPPAYKDIKPTVNVESYEYSNPQSGFDDGNNRESLSDQREFKNEAPQTYQRQRDYDYTEERDPRKVVSDMSAGSPKTHEHHYHYDYPEKTPRKASSPDYESEKATREEDPKEANKKSPKMMKKSFAYYRKDKPKEDPNDQHYAEEYAQGNYRSFSSDYDSERDGPKKV